MFPISRCRLFLKKFTNRAVDIVRKYGEVNIYDKNPVAKRTPIDFFMQILECRTMQEAKTILENYDYMRDVDCDEIVKTMYFLKSQNIPMASIKNHMNILAYNAITVQNYYAVLQECGFAQIGPLHLAKFVTILNRSIYVLKANNFIPMDVSVPDRLIECAGISSLKDDLRLTENEALRLQRKCILRQLLADNIEMSDKEFDEMWKRYVTVRNKPFRAIIKILDLLKNNLKFSNEKIRNNLYLLYADYENVWNILYTLKTISGLDTRHVLEKRPKIAMTNYQRLDKIQKHIRDFGIPDSAVEASMDIFTLGPDTVYERLIELRNVKEFDVLINHPRVLKLVTYQNKARIRLEYLKQLKIKCVSLNILAGSSDAFERYVREGSDKTQGRDVVSMLANAFEKPEHDIRNYLSRHPNWYNIPAVTIRTTLDSLKHRKYDMDTIYDNIHILLYPIERIDETIETIANGNKFSDLCTKPLTKNQLLRLAIYLIELEYHFTGDGVWTEQHSQPPEPYHRFPEMPSTLVKQYKYGRVPATKLETSM